MKSGKQIFKGLSNRNFWVLILVLLVINLFSPKGLFRLLMMKQEIIRLDAQSKIIETEIANTRIDLQEFRKSSIAKERAIRSELGLLKPGEWSIEFPTIDNETN
jgi:uncharacterized membrane protein